MTDPLDDRQLVTVWNPSYTGRIGVIGDYQSSAPTWQRNGVGTATIVVDEDVEHPEPVLQLSQNVRSVVPVTIVDRGRRWTGRVAHCERTGPPGRGTVTATLVSDYVWVRSMLGWPVPTADLAGQSTEYDIRTGPVETAVRGYLQAAIDRLNVPLAVLPAQEPDVSPTTYPTPQSRFDPLDEVIGPLLTATNRLLEATLWMPDDDALPGLTLTRPTIVLTVRAAPHSPHVTWTDSNGILSRTLATTSPNAYRAPIGMKGEGVERRFTQVIDTALAADLGEYGLPETMVNATDVDTDADGQARGRAKLAEDFAGTAALSIDVGDGEPWTLGYDYDVGSVVRATTAGVHVEDFVDRVTVTHNRAAGRVVTPQIGPTSTDESTDALVVQRVADITAAIARMASHA